MPADVVAVINSLAFMPADTNTLSVRGTVVFSVHDNARITGTETYHMQLHRALASSHLKPDPACRELVPLELLVR